MFLEWQTECCEESVCLFVSLGCGYECDLHAMDPRVLVDVDLREDDLLLETERVVTLSVHLLGDTVEVSDSREGDADEPLEEFVHLHVAESDFDADRHALAETEVGNVLLGGGENGLLADDLCELLCSLLDKLLVGSGLADTLIDGDLDELRNLHYGGVGELLHELIYDLLPIDLLERRYVISWKCLDFYWSCDFLCHNYLISSPDFLA